MQRSRQFPVGAVVYGFLQGWEIADGDFFAALDVIVGLGSGVVDGGYRLSLVVCWR